MNSIINRAMIADDDEFFRMALAAILRRDFAARDISEAASLEEGLALLSAGPPFDLAVFDLDMPGMSGALSIGAARQRFPDLKLVIATTTEDRRSVLDALEAGVHGYIPKGGGAAAITAGIAAILSGSIYVPSMIAKAPAAVPVAAGLPRLTARQAEVLDLLVKGMSNKEICRVLRLGDGTVKVHIAALLKALNVKNRAAAAAIGARLAAGRGVPRA